MLCIKKKKNEKFYGVNEFVQFQLRICRDSSWSKLLSVQCLV